MDEYNKNNLDKAKYLRKNMTDAESLMWNFLRAKRFFGIKFKRQVLIGEYIVDFLAPIKKVIIEIDGGQHNQDDVIKYDSKRTEYLESLGYSVFRFWNNDVLNNIDGVLEYLKNNID